MRIVTEYQEKLTQQQAALEASFQYIPDAEAAAKQYALVVEGLTARLQGRRRSHRSRSPKPSSERTRRTRTRLKALDEMSVFAEEAARTCRMRLQNFCSTRSMTGSDGMLEGFAKTLRKMAAELVAAKLFEKFNIEDVLKPGGLTTGPGTEWFKNLFGFGGAAAGDLRADHRPRGTNARNNHRDHRRA